MADSKCCTKCGSTKVLSDFTRDRTKKDGFYSSCRNCCVAAGKKRNKNSKAHYDREYRKTLGLKKKANELKVPVELLQRMMTAQKGLCKICKRPEIAVSAQKHKIKRLALDHCHKTGAPRGFLCQRCNTGLGVFNDNIETLRSAIQYLGG